MSISLVLGFFDGVHKAHRAVIDSALKNSDNAVLVTLDESPAVYFGGEREYILSRKDSLLKAKSLGIKDILELDFKKCVSMNAHDYLEFLISKYHPVSISTGFNHTFGSNKSGNSEFLKQNSEKYGYNYICVSPILNEGEIISSTLIKNYLKNGNIKKANLLLESNFILEGTVIHGAKIGRTIGFPTANIEYPKEIVKIPFGVYEVNIGNNKGIMNWGMKPTVHNTVSPIVEVHILNYSGDLYGKNVKIEVLNKIRGEQKFNNLDELKEQIKKDIKACSEL